MKHDNKDFVFQTFFEEQSLYYKVSYYLSYLFII